MVDSIRVGKLSASRVIQRLKQLELVDNSYKIDQDEDYVYIPVLSNNREDFEGLEVNFIFVNRDFEEREYRPASLKEALFKLLPNVDESLFQTSYDQIGNIAVIDLNYELEDYSSEVGEAILWSNPSIKSVFQKSSKVEGLLRIRGLELIAGIENTKTVHKEHGINIVVDIAKAYFSPRLATEHHRIATKVEEGSVVLDMFGSLAPFALHIAKEKEVRVVTLDINPYVPDLIGQSINLNNLVGTIEIVEDDAFKFAKNCSQKFDYIIMNHPSGAYDFLPEAISLGNSGGNIFYYDFIPIDNYKTIISQKLQKFEDSVEILGIHIVRQSSPTEYHVCVTLHIK